MGNRCSRSAGGCVRSNEGVRRHDDLVARLHLGQQRCHLEPGRAGMREQGLVRAGARLQPGRAALGKTAIAGQVPLGMCLRNVPQFLARHVGLVEGDVHGGGS